MFEIGHTQYALLGAMLFAIGAAGALTRKNVLVILMSIELMLNAVNLTFLAFASRHIQWKITELGREEIIQSVVVDPLGQAAAFFVLAVAAAEAAVGLAIIVAVFRTSRATSVDESHLLKW